mgnify:CR=1 FL=1
MNLYDNSTFYRNGYKILGWAYSNDATIAKYALVITEEEHNKLEELTEKHEIARVCHNNLLNADSRHILDEIEKEFNIFCK